MSNSMLMSISSLVNCMVAMNVSYLSVLRHSLNSRVSRGRVLTAVYFCWVNLDTDSLPRLIRSKARLDMQSLHPLLPHSHRLTSGTNMWLGKAHWVMVCSVRREKANNSGHRRHINMTSLARVYSCSALLIPRPVLDTWMCRPAVSVLCPNNLLSLAASMMLRHGMVSMWNCSVAGLDTISTPLRSDPSSLK